jgi:hypothetical protein
LASGNPGTDGLLTIGIFSQRSIVKRRWQRRFPSRQIFNQPVGNETQQVDGYLRTLITDLRKVLLGDPEQIDIAQAGRGRSVRAQFRLSQ